MSIVEIKGFIANHRDSGTLFVLKGYAVDDCGGENAALDETIDGKLQRMIALSGQQDQVISFDEFICLYDFLVQQYRRIYLIENPVYHALYPVGAEIKPEISAFLLAHFDEDAGEDREVGELSEYTNIYGNFVRTGMGIACCYNYDESILIHEKIERRVLPQASRAPSKVMEVPEGYEYLNICSDVDYYEFVRSLALTDKRYAVTWDHFALGKEAIERHINALGALYADRVLTYIPRRNPIGTAIAPEVLGLMKRYWGYDSFRDFKVYDMEALQQGRKEVREISQGRIIADLIGQTERCVRGEAFRDVFVTAPTGAGKSLIFQLPAMYLAEKYGLVTLVITPLIGLMNDQVQMLKNRGYTGARTIHSDISPILKQEILHEVAEGKCHILYLSPESLLSRSDVQMLIGQRRIGMLVVDEAHIVTTWGKQFRPDYWYLGDHVQKLRRIQSRRQENPAPFIIATFTATAIYEGKEDMYHETLNSLHMIDPITYLGYLRRDNISIDVSEVEVRRNRTEYEINKFDALIAMVKTALMRGQKVLIYFPTVALINRFYDYCFSQGLSKYVVRYHGQMDAADKEEGFEAFRDGSKKVMAATKAFGMGIDIPDIAIVSHFAPTGNVCDYMQEIGRAARDTSIDGHAVYRHMSNDFQHINRLHGLSAIRRYQLVEVIKKVLEIYVKTRYQNAGKPFTKKRNEMLVDAESFGYIFDSTGDDNELINKVKTAMLLIQKDYENRGFAPFYMRPIPLFAHGFFALPSKEREQIDRRYGDTVKVVDARQDICEVDLEKIWKKDYQQHMSFPKFKFLLYSQNEELDLVRKWNWTTAMAVDIFMESGYEETYRRIVDALKKVTHESAYSGSFISLEEMIDSVAQGSGLSQYRAESMVNVVIAAMDTYQKEYAQKMTANIFRARPTRSGKVSYAFSNTVRAFYSWLDRGRKKILESVQNQKMYVVNIRKNYCKEITTVLGLLEAFGVLRFRSLGGSNSQLYIYVNETKTMQMVRDRPGAYRNRLLEVIRSRHDESVRMMTFLFQSGFKSDELWGHLENYFLGILPPALRDGNR